jgi:hypothetical protein
MLPKLLVFEFQHLSVGSALQNFAVYSLIAFMLMIVLVQLNIGHETGVRRFLTTRASWLAHMMQPGYRALCFKVKQLISRH